MMIIINLLAVTRCPTVPSELLLLGGNRERSVQEGAWDSAAIMTCGPLVVPAQLNEVFTFFKKVTMNTHTHIYIYI